MNKIIVAIFVGIISYQTITGFNDTMVSITSDDSEAIDAIVFAFGQNTTKKEILLTEGFKSDSNQTIYKLKVKINYYNECNDNETSIWITRTERGCRTTSFCRTEVTKLNSNETAFSMDSMQCIA